MLLQRLVEDTRKPRTGKRNTLLRERTGRCLVFSLGRSPIAAIAASGSGTAADSTLERKDIAGHLLRVGLRHFRTRRHVPRR
jgi:hypothetical protein